MNSHFLTTKYFIKGKIIDQLEKLISINLDFPKYYPGDKYKLIRWIKEQDDNDNLTSIGIFKYQSKNVVVKQVNYKLKDSIYEQIINEFSMFNLLNELSEKTKNSKDNIRFPKVYKLISKPHYLGLVTEFLDAQSLESKQNSYKISYLKIILDNLEIMSNLINEKSRKLLPRRTYFQILISFPLYLVKVIIGDLGNINSYIRLLFVFYKNYFSLSNFRMKYILAHKDLHSGNILIGKNEIIVIDPEICVLADEVTDIAHIARYYSNKFSDKEMKSILNFSLKTNRQKKNFISLSIYYSIQMMAIRNKNNASYVEAKNYLFKYFDRIKLTYL